MAYETHCGNFGRYGGRSPHLEGKGKILGRSLMFIFRLLHLLIRLLNHVFAALIFSRAKCHQLLLKPLSLPGSVAAAGLSAAFEELSIVEFVGAALGASMLLDGNIDEEVIECGVGESVGLSECRPMGVSGKRSVPLLGFGSIPRESQRIL